MALSRSKKELIHEMNEVAPLEPISQDRQPYIEALMGVYAKQEAIAFAHWLQYQKDENKNTEQLYKDFLHDVS